MPPASEIKGRAERKSGGRPRKFATPSRPVTLTLPESTLRDLQHVDPDPAHAIVKLTRMALQNGGTEKPNVEIVRTSGDMGIIVIGPSRTLSQISFLHLVEVAPARYLLAVESGHDFKSLEIAINDALEEVGDSDKRERQLMVELRQKIKSLRKSDKMSPAEILFVRAST